MDAYPKLFFKFKSITKSDSLSNIDEIISDHKLYFPNRKHLNDPFEGGTKRLRVPGTAGAWYYQINDKENPYLGEIKGKYRILCLSSNCFSPLMWAHYANEGKGLCLCFHTNKSFSIARPVIYDEFIDDGEIIPEAQVEEKVYDSFFVKHPDWRYENEWRIVEQSENSYYQFEADELAAVIFGYSMSEGNKRIIKRMLSPEIKQYEAHIGGQSGSIRLIPDEYVFPGDGTNPDFISTVDEMYEAVMRTD